MKVSLNKFLSAIIIAIIVGTIGTLAYVIATPRSGSSFTEFYILGLEGKAVGYPAEIALGEEGSVIVGIINREQRTVSYRVESMIEGQKYYESEPLVLVYDEEWEEIINFVPDRAGDDQKVEFLLYKNGESEPYLEPLYLFINVKEPERAGTIDR